MFEYLACLILFFSIPLILKARDYLYKKHNLIVGAYENTFFYIGLFLFLIIHSMITNSELSACLSIAPLGNFVFYLFKNYWHVYIPF